MTELQRHFELEGAFNLRDLGGYATSSGGRVRWRRLFRSDSLHRLTDDDLAAVGDLGIATVIDLRTGDEVARRGSFDSVRSYRHMPLIERLTSDDDMGNIYSDPKRVTARYLEILELGRDQMGEVLSLLVDES